MMLSEILNILSEVSAFDSANENSKLKEDLGIDSLGMVTLLVMLEDHFKIILDESDMNPFDLQTVGDVVSIVEKYMEKSNEK